MRQMKTTICAIAIICLSTALLGCQGGMKNVVKRDELTPLGIEYPNLLPSEKAHPVRLNLSSTPKKLTSNDIAEISSMVGRVPGLPRYEIGMIEDSWIHPGFIHVSVAPVIIMMEKQQHWIVFKIFPYSY